MKKIIFMFCLVLLSLSSASEKGESEKRKSYFGFNIDLGENRYRDFLVNGAWGINSIWQTGVAGSTSDDQDSNRYQMGSIFISGRWNDYFDNKVTLFRSKEQPEELTGSGAELKTTAKYPVFKEGFYTTLALTLGNTRYQQETYQSRVLGATTVIKDFVQRYVVFELSQDVLEWLLVGLEMTKYSYEDASEASFTGNKRKFSISTSVDGSSDYPDKKTKLYLSALYQRFLFDVALAKTFSKLQNNDSVNRSLDISYELSNQFYPSLGISSIKYDDHSTNETLSLGLDLVF